MRKSGLFIAMSLIAIASAGGQQAAPDARGNPRRAMLEERLRERTGAIVKQRLGLSDAQMMKLQATNKQFEPQRSSMLVRERELRRELRQQLLAGDGASQSRVSQLLDQAMQVERQRLDLQQSEQKELAKFLTPVQRAKLFGLQGEIRRRAQDMRNRPGKGQGRVPLTRNMRPR